MKKHLGLLVVPALILSGSCLGCEEHKQQNKKVASKKSAPTSSAPTSSASKSNTSKSNTSKNTKKKEIPVVLNFKMKSLSGQDVDLSKYSGRVVLMVNVASQCGYTPQYKGLQELHKKYSAQGLSVLGFPSNDFGAQEPGSETEIGEFCKKNYGVEFDMFSKVQVKGEGKTPLYEHLTSEKTNPQFAGEVAWNFEKFLVGRNGEIVARFKSNIAPDAPELVKAIETELAKQ